MSVTSDTRTDQLIMANDPFVRAMLPGDIPSLRAVLDDTGLFPSALLDGMAAPFLRGEGADIWLVVGHDDAALGFAYCEPERLTDGTYNLLAIAVMSDVQGQGLGKALIDRLQTMLRQAGARVLLVETSSLDDYAGTRDFYDRLGFTREARIRDFYAAGEDKIVFWKTV